jgi:hypothetical protein
MHMGTWIGGVGLGLGASALALMACSGDREVERAAAAFRSFQDALQRGDQEAVRGLITLESAPAIAEIDWSTAKNAPQLTVVGGERGLGDFRIHVAPTADGQPAASDKTAEFVVVREYGKYVVDLVATAGLHTEVVEATARRSEFVPQPLSPRDLDRIREIELARPATASKH